MNILSSTKIAALDGIVTGCWGCELCVHCHVLALEISDKTKGFLKLDYGDLGSLSDERNLCMGNRCFHVYLSSQGNKYPLSNKITTPFPWYNSLDRRPTRFSPSVRDVTREYATCGCGRPAGTLEMGRTFVQVNLFHFQCV